MARGVRIRPRDADAIRRELSPFMARLRALAAEHDLSIATIIKFASLPEPIPVRPVAVKGLHAWNDRIAGL